MKKLSILLVLAVAALTSCKKDETVETGTLYMHLHTNIDTNEAEQGEVYHDASGRQYQLDVAQFYVSGIVLEKSNGDLYTVEDVFILKTIGTEQYLVGDVPVGDYKSVRFDVGVVGPNNETTPASHMAPDALAEQTPSMWFGNITQGYIFMNVQGLADTTAGNNGPVNTPFSYQLGTDAQLTTVTMPDKPFTVTKGTAQELHITADYGKLLEGVNFKTQSTATPFNNGATATQIAGNIAGMFSYEE